MIDHVLEVKREVKVRSEKLLRSIRIILLASSDVRNIARKRETNMLNERERSNRAHNSKEEVAIATDK